MPLYYFDLYEDGVLTRDEYGVELESVYEAREQAVALLPDLARDGLPTGGDRHDFVALVRGPGGRVHYEAKLSLRGRWVEDEVTPPAGKH